ncbi:MAG TPA: hypothetical protein PKK43_14035, partial [Spirochaetota bacterium]|nr:hypothetical protein [Spirochaetota bacterium]
AAKEISVSRPASAGTARSIIMSRPDSFITRHLLRTVHPAIRARNHISSMHRHRAQNGGGN